MQLYSFTGSGYACLKKSVSRMLGQWNCDRNDVVVGCRRNETIASNAAVPTAAEYTSIAAQHHFILFVVVAALTTLLFLLAGLRDRHQWLHR